MIKWLAGFMIINVCLLAGYGAVEAEEPARSTNYQIDESFVGGGGLIQSGSNSYQLGDSIGDTAVGNSASGNFQVNAGSVTTNDPSLAFAVNSSGVNFGSFSSGTPTTATASFQVYNYTSYGYVVQIVGNPPSNGAHTLAALASTTTSQTGTEQFGINLVANTSPVSFGANPDHGQFGAGSAAGNYGTANNFRYVSGETIVSAPQSSGTTVYTISYLVNVSTLTPGGIYNSNQVLVCTGTY